MTYSLEELAKALDIELETLKKMLKVFQTPLKNGEIHKETYYALLKDREKIKKLCKDNFEKL
jgi:hypothetical protein